jgi:hypothetical protein
MLWLHVIDADLLAEFISCNPNDLPSSRGSASFQQTAQLDFANWSDGCGIVAALRQQLPPPGRR